MKRFCVSSRSPFEYTLSDLTCSNTPSQCATAPSRTSARTAARSTLGTEAVAVATATRTSMGPSAAVDGCFGMSPEQLEEQKERVREQRAHEATLPPLLPCAAGCRKHPIAASSSV